MHRAPGVAAVPLPLRRSATATRFPWSRCLCLAVGILLLPGHSQGQDLVAAAAKERERRREIGKPSRTITERELALNRPTEPVTLPPIELPPAASARSVEAFEAPETVSEEEEREDRQDAWRQMLEGGRADMARSAAEVDRLQASLNNLSGLYGSARAERISQLERAKHELAAARRVVDDIESLGRQHGYR